MKGEKAGWVVMGVVTVVGLVFFSCCLLVRLGLRRESRPRVVVSEQRPPSVEPTSVPDPNQPVLLWEQKGFYDTLVDDEAVYVIDSDRKVAALEFAGGTRVWTWEHFERAVEFVAQSESKLFVWREDDRIYALDKRTGQTVWKYIFNYEPSRAWLVGDRLYLEFDTVYAIALDAETGGVVWEQEGSRLRICEATEEVVTLFPEASGWERGGGGVVGSVWILDAETGNIRGEIQNARGCYGTIADSAGVYSISNDDRYISSTDLQTGELNWKDTRYIGLRPLSENILAWEDWRESPGGYAVLDLNTGQQLSAFTITGVEYSGTLEELIFFVSEDLGKTYAIDLLEGRIRWSNDELKATWPVTSTRYGLLLANKDEGRLYLVDPKTGHFVWGFADDATYPRISSLLLLDSEDNDLFVTGFDSCYLFDLETGTVVWQKRMGCCYDRLHRTNEFLIVLHEDYAAVFRY